MRTREQKVAIADRLYDNFDFGIEVKDSSGWEDESPTLVVRTVFFEGKGDEPSTKGRFCVDFGGEKVQCWAEVNGQRMEEGETVPYVEEYEVKFSATGWIRQRIQIVDCNLSPDEVQAMLNDGRLITTVQEGGEVLIQGGGELGPLHTVGKVISVDNNMEYTDFEVEAD